MKAENFLMFLSWPHDNPISKYQRVSLQLTSYFILFKPKMYLIIVAPEPDILRIP